MTTTFIRAAEVWAPSDDGQLLEYRAGAFGTARRFEAISQSMCFGRGEGLPGRAWDEGRPQLLRQFDAAHFRRAAAAQAAGFTCAAALPFFTGDVLKAVLVVYCAHGAGAASALELWHQDPRVTTDMTLVDGAYGPGAQTFESISHDTTLPRGVGLPGLAWQRGEGVFMEDITDGTGRFLRAAYASSAGLQRGLALPAGARSAESHVLTFLAGASLPLAQRVERWAPGENRARLHRVEAFSELHGGRSQADASLPLDGAGSIAQAFASGMPAINAHPRSEPGAPAAAAAGIGATALIVVPVQWEDEVSEVVALYL
ncbi:GAF domain-containing protein [Aquincola sp. MAHUQ-54]|uniref:GAF domain-containing protein n=1 Tax=Aquincola agrisoli TaxID=3119538 RepID=A0AAW9QC98_9BURK